VAESIQRESGGIRSLLDLLNGEYGEAVQADLLKQSWCRWDLGRRLGWSDFRIIVNWLPPSVDSAYFRARKPNSWWKMPEHDLLAGILFAGEGANWQRGGCKGDKPKPVKFPEDRDVKVRDQADLADKRQAQSAHLKRRRADRKR
jgi:hypothetical protein